MKALSIRQPWAWLIIYAAKDIENRDWPTAVRGRVLIHAGQTMTRAEYWDAAAFLATSPSARLRSLVALLPRPDELKRGGIVGSVEVVNCVLESTSPWFVGRYGLVVRHPLPCEFRPYKGKLGFFEVAI